jgi:hypothetical protein
MVRRHVADLGLLQKTNWRRGARWNERQEAHPGGSANLVCFASSRARGRVLPAVAIRINLAEAAAGRSLTRGQNKEKGPLRGPLFG